MVAAVSGAGLGLFGSSVSMLGGAGAAGNAGVGRGNDRVYVNTATGNLIIQSQDERLSALGLDLALVRTYNSQGLLDDDNGDNWRLGVNERVYGLTGTLNTAGSQITKEFGDGREVVYHYDTTRGCYVSTEGDGAHDTLTNSGGTWTWTDGSARNTETYNSSGQLTQSKDADGNTISYEYTGSLLTQITDASGQVTHLDYTGNNLTQISVESDGHTQTLTHYSYDSSNRLTQVKVDLSPEDNSIADNDVYTTTYTYDGTSKRIASITQTDGSSVAFTYEEATGRLKTYTDGEGRVTTFTYTEGSGEGDGTPTTVSADDDVLDTTDTQTTTDDYDVDSDSLSTTDTETTTETYDLDTDGLTSTGSPAPSSVLHNGVPVSFSANGGTWTYYTIEVPAGTSALSVFTHGGTGDLSLLARRGAEPTWDDHDYASNDSDNDEVLFASDPAAGTWYIGVLANGDNPVSGAELQAQFQSGTDAVQTLVPGEAVTDLSGNGDDDTARIFTFDVAAGTTGFRLDLSGLNGDTDLLLQQGSIPDPDSAPYYSIGPNSNESILVTDPAAGTWYLVVKGYRAFSDAKLTFNTNVVNAPPSVSAAPVSNALSGTTVNLSATGSDAEGAVSYEWTQVGGPEVTLTNGTSANASFTAPSVTDATVLTFKVKVTDALGASNTDIVRMLVNPPVASYTVLAGDTWASIAQTLYGSPLVASQLQSALGSPALTTGVQLTGLPLGLSAGAASFQIAAQGDTHLLHSGVPVENLSAAQDTSQYYTIEVPEGATELTLSTLGGTGDVNLYVSRGAPPVSGGDYYFFYSHQVGFIENPAAGTWYIQVAASSAFSGVELKAEYQTATEEAQTLTPGEAVVGISGDQDMKPEQMFSFEIPEGTSSFQLDLQGINGDPDMYLKYADEPTRDDYDYRAIDVLTDRIFVSNATPGTWYLMVRASDRFTDAKLLLNTNVSNIPPHVEAATVEATESGSNVALTATGTDAEGAVSYDWTQVGGLTVTVTNGSTASADFVAPSVTAQTVLTFKVKVTDARGASDTDLVRVLVNPSTLSYVVQSGDSWSSIAAALYGTADVADQLQTALGNPALDPDAELTGLPATLSVSTSETVTVPPYHLIATGETWQSIAADLYGVDSEAAGAALQSAMGNPELTAGDRLTSLPSVLTVSATETTTVPPYYVVQTGDTWSSITQAIYGVSDAEAIAALQTSLGNPTLSVGLHLTVPSTLTYGSDEGGTGTGARTDVLDALGLTTSYISDAEGRLVSVLSPTVNGTRLETQYAYDAYGNVTSITEDPDGLNRVTTMTYDANGNVLSSRDSAGNTVTRTYNADNQLLTETQYAVRDPDGAGSGQPSVPLTTRYVYDAEDHLRFTISAEGRVTENRYNTAGQLITTLKYAGALYTAVPFALTDLSSWASTRTLTELERTDYGYDFRGNLSTLTAYTATDSSGVGVGVPSVTQFVYDQRGQLLQTLDALGMTPNAGNANVPYATTYTYDGLGRVSNSTQWNSGSSLNGTVTVYDDVNRRTTTTFANGLITTSVYNRDGDLISVINGASGVLGTTTYAYDADGRLRITTDPTGVKQFYLYDEAGRKSAQVDGDGTLTEFIYDRAGELIKTVQYAVRIASTTLASLVDGSGNPTAVTLATLRTAASGSPSQDRITRNVYDSAGLLVYAIDDAGGVTQSFHDGAGRITDEIRFAKPVIISRSVDEVLPSAVSVVIDAVNDRHTRNFYDADGKLLGTLDGAGYLVEYQYDSAGHLVHQTGYATKTNSAYWSTGTLAQLRPATDTETVLTPEQDIVSHFFYDGEGRQIGVLDGEGYLSETVYDVAGNVTQSIRYGEKPTYTAGVSTFQTLKTAATTASAANTHRTSYEYDGAGRVTKQTDYEGTVTAYAYDAVGDLLSTTTAQGTAEASTTATRYDVLGRVTQELSAEGQARLTGGSGDELIWDQYGVRYKYDLAGRKISATVKPNDTQTNITYYYYDNDNRLRFEVNALGERKEYRYNALNQVTDEITYYNRISTSDLTGGLLTPALITSLSAYADAGDAKTSYTYSLTGKIASTTTAQGASTSYTYNAFGEVYTSVQKIDATDSLTHVYKYDTRGELDLTTWDAVSGGLNTTEARDYDAFGRLTTVTDARGNTSSIEYDRLGRQIATVDGMGARSAVVYDAFSRQLTTRDALGNETTYAYDDTARSITMTTPEGVAVKTLYDAHGQVLTVYVGAELIKTGYGYDHDGNLLYATDHLGYLEQHTYDRAGRVITSTDGDGVVTSFEYDAANRVVTRIVDPAGLALKTTYTYDGEGRTVDVTEPGGRLTRTSYDPDGRVTDVAVDPDGLNLRTHYTYDLTGNIITVAEGYDGNSPTIPRVTQYIYDVLGRRTDEFVDLGTGTNPASNAPYLNLHTQYKYDADGNLTRKIDAKGNSTWYVYDADNRVTLTIDALGGVTQTSYDAVGRVISTRRYANALSTSGFGDEVTSISLSTSAADRVTQSVYDKDGREQYTIDAMGGVTERTFDDQGNVTRTRLYAKPIAVGAYTTRGGVELGLGLAGNILSSLSADDRVQWTAYDDRGRAVFTVDGLGAVVQSTYDHNGNVISTTAYASLRSTLLDTTLSALSSWSASNTGNAANRITRYWYDAAGRQRFMLDAEGYLTESRYNDAGRIETSIVYAAKPTLYSGAALSAVITAAGTVNPAVDQVTTTLYDAAGRVSTVTDAYGNYDAYTYDDVGNKLSYRNQSGSVWTYDYDANGRLTDEHSPSVDVTTVSGDDGELSAAPPTSQSIVTHMTYDDLGNVQTRTEAYGTAQARTTTYEYDKLGRQTKTTYPPVQVYNSGTGDSQLGASGVSRTESLKTLTSEVSYDVLGNAFRNRDVAGNDSYKLYDRLGRVTDEIDALGYVTHYAYDTFGNQTSLTRYATAKTSGAPTSGFDTVTVAHTGDDRTITTAYDRLNRVLSVTQSASYVFDTTSGTGYGGTSETTGARTEYQYNAFGQVTLERRLVSGSTYAETYNYYDRMGRKTAQIDPLGFLTTYQYDETGDLTGQTEFVTPVSGTYSTSGYTTPATASGDRIATYSYDRLNRLKTEQHTLDYSSFSGSTLNTTTGADLTEYGYDAVGNRTSVTVNGATTYTQYDALGRITAVAEPLRDRGDGLTLRPLTVTRRDAFGNAVEVIQYAKGAGDGTDPDFDGTSDAADRITKMEYDSHGDLIHSEDATGAHSYMSYDERGQVAKQWQPVTNNDGVTENLVTLYKYDALGRQTSIKEPQSFSGPEGTVIVERTSAYNAFGEVTLKTNGGQQEYFDYDNAGHVWRTNTGDGVVKLYLYNLAGQATVEIRSQDTDLGRNNSAIALQSLQLLQNNLLPGVTQMRTETVYDQVGRVVAKRDVEYDADSLVDQSSATFRLGNLSSANQVFLYFDNDRPNDTIKLQYRTAGTNDDWIDGPAVSQLSGAIWGADVSALRGTKEFRVTFTAPGASTYHLIHTGTFTVDAERDSNVLELHPQTTALANNLTITASGSNVTAQWSAKPSVSQARFEMSLDGVTWYSANAALSGGLWGATLSNIQDDPDGSSLDWKYRVVEDVDGTPVTMSVGTLEKDGATLVTNTDIQSTAQPFDALDIPSISVSPPTQLADVEVDWNPFSGNYESSYFLWRPLQPAGAAWHTITGLSSSYSLPNLPPGGYQIQIDKWETIYPFDAPPYPSVTATTDGTFTVNSNGTVTLNIPPSQNSLSVTVAATPHAPVADVTIAWTRPTAFDSYDVVGWKLVGAAGSGSSFPNQGSVGNSGTVSLQLQYGQSYEIQVERYAIANTLPPEPALESHYTFTFTVGGTNPSPVFTSGTIPYIGPVEVDTADQSVLHVPRPPRSGSRIDVEFTGMLGTPGSFSRTFIAPAGDGSWSLDLDNPGPGEAALPPGNYSFSVYYFDANNVFYANNGGSLELTQTLSGPGKIQIRSVTSPEQIDTLRQIDDPVVGGGRALLYWDTPSGTSGDQIKFQVLWDDPNDGISGRVWRTLPLIAVGTGWAVDLSALPLSDFSYELTYTRPSEGSPHRIASGIVSVYQPTVTGTNLTDTTSSSAELDPASVIPLFEQSLDRWGNVLSYTVAAQTDAEQTTHYAYNQHNQVTRVTSPTVSVRSTINGIVSAPVDDQPIISGNYYDLNGNLIATVDPNGNRNRIWYNLAGQVLSEQQAESTSITGTATGAKHYVYDAFGEQIQITDELGYLTRMSYDAGGLLRRVSREVTAGAFFAADDAADGATNGTVANPREVLETFNYAFDPNHIVTVAYDYDQAGRRIRETTGEQMTSGGAETIKYWYDLQGNLTRSRLPMGASYDTTYSYDQYGNGKKILEVDAIGGTQNWQYDSFGNLQSYTDIHGELGGETTGSTVTYQYDRAGLLTRQTSTYGQDITYGYDNAGHLTSIVEDSTAIAGMQELADVNRRTYYSYDAAGRRTREQVFVDDHEYQDTIASYDAQGRISHLQDDRYNTTYEYDKAGNRTHISTQYTETPSAGSTTQIVDDLWYTYDGANRVTISQGRLADGMVTDQNPSIVFPDDRSQAVRITYNAAGQRVESEQFGPNYFIDEATGNLDTFEYGRYVSHYEYDGLGRLTKQSRMPGGGSYVGNPEDELWDKRTYDGASRLKTQNIKTIENNEVTTRDSVMVYDDNGQLASQASQVLDFSTGIYKPVDSTLTYGQATYSNGVWTQGFDAAGNLRSYSVATTNSNTHEVETVDNFYTYRSGSSYAEISHREDDGHGSAGGTTQRGYNLDGELVAFLDQFAPEKNRYFVNNADGQAIKVVQGDFTSLTPQQLQDTFEGVDHDNLPQHQLIFDGKLIGSLQSDGTRFVANFDVNYTPVTEQYPAATPTQVVVQTGDTLRIMAARIWGDGNLWYLIAEENGLQDGPDGLLNVGELLQIPNEVVSLSNTSNSFKPFNVSDVIGDTTPTQPAPPAPKNGGGCGGLGQVLVLVVAVIVSMYLGPEVASAFSGATSAGAAATAGTLTSYAAGYAVGAAAGNAIGQGFGIAIGAQGGFDWKSVAAAGVAAGIGSLAEGVGGASGLLGMEKDVGSQILNAGVNSAINQGVNIALGLQDKFNWTAVASAALAAPLASRANSAFNDGFGPFAGNLAGNLINQGAYAIAAGGKVNYVQLAADAFGNALGNSIVDRMSPQSKAPAVMEVEQPGAGSAVGNDELDFVVPTAQRLPEETQTLDPGNRTAAFDGGTQRSPDDQRNATLAAQRNERLQRRDVDDFTAQIKAEIETVDGPGEASGYEAQLKMGDKYWTTEVDDDGTTRRVRAKDALTFDPFADRDFANKSEDEVAPSQRRAYELAKDRSAASADVDVDTEIKLWEGNLSKSRTDIDIFGDGDLLRLSSSTDIGGSAVVTKEGFTLKGSATTASHVQYAHGTYEAEDIGSTDVSVRSALELGGSGQFKLGKAGAALEVGITAEAVAFQANVSFQSAKKELFGGLVSADVSSEVALNALAIGGSAGVVAGYDDGRVQLRAKMSANVLFGAKIDVSANIDMRPLIQDVSAVATQTYTNATNVFELATRIGRYVYDLGY